MDKAKQDDIDDLLANIYEIILSWPMPEQRVAVDGEILAGTTPTATVERESTYALPS
jgi:hypothetical protein